MRDGRARTRELRGSDTPATWGEVLAATRRALADGGVGPADAEARWIVEEVSGREVTELVAAGREAVAPHLAERVTAMVSRRRAGEPLQYVLGSWSFRGLDLFVDPRVLVPRPETETTVEVAIAEAVRLGVRRGRADAWRGAPDAPDEWGEPGSSTIVDLGTGSGAIALALAAELPDVQVWATDVSTDALAVANANLSGTGVGATRVRTAAGHWFDALPLTLRGDVLVIVSNPPYVAEHEVASLPREVADHEPRVALVSGPSGLEAIEAIIHGAAPWLVPGGSLVVELAPHQAEPARALARAAGFVDVHLEPDPQGLPRVLVARRA